MLANIKNILMILVVLLVLGGLGAFVFKSCGPVKPVVGGPSVVSVVKTATPTDEERKLIPSNHEILTVLKPNIDVDNIWSKTHTDIIVHKDAKCNTCTTEYTQVLSGKTVIGFSFKPKFALGYADSTLIPYYDQEFLRFGKTSFGVLVSMPYLGLALDYSITKGFFIGAAGDFKYIQYKSIGDLGSYVIVGDFYKSVYPEAHIGFHF